MTFSNSNTYYGGTTISGGTLLAANNAALGAGTVGVGQAGTLNVVVGGLQTTSLVVAGAVNVAGGGLTTTGAAGVTVNSTGVLNIGGGSLQTASLAVTGGTSTWPMRRSASFTHSSGLTTFGSAVTIGTADVSAGLGTVNAAAPLAIQSMLKLPAGVTATLTGGTSFGVSGANLANSAQASTLTLSGGVLTFAPVVQGTSGAAINVLAGGVAYTGLGPSSDTGTYWNNPGLNGTLTGLKNSSGATMNVSYTAAGAYSTYSTGANPATLLSEYSFVNPGTMTFTFGGLTLGTSYDLYAIMNSNTIGRATAFTVGGTSQAVTTQPNFATVSVTATTTYAEFVGLTPNVSGQIIVTASSGSASFAEVDVNGFQLIPVGLPVSGSLNLPNANIAATASSVLDLGGNGPANTFGGLSLAGSVTVQNVASGGSVQFGGDVVASANAAVVLSAGTGSIPALVLAGAGNIQNIKAANGAALTLPALAISANTVNIGNAAGYKGSVVLGGATTLTGSTSPTVNVNAGSLEVGSTLASPAAGAYVEVNTGGQLVNQPAGVIQVPVTVNSGGTLAGTGYLGSVTVNPGGTLAPGDALGVMNLSGSLILESGAVMKFGLDTPLTSDMISCGASGP